MADRTLNQSWCSLGSILTFNNPLDTSNAASQTKRLQSPTLYMSRLALGFLRMPVAPLAGAVLRAWLQIRLPRHQLGNSDAHARFAGSVDGKWSAIVCDPPFACVCSHAHAFEQGEGGPQARCFINIVWRKRERRGKDNKIGAPHPLAA